MDIQEYNPITPFGDDSQATRHHLIGVQGVTLVELMVTLAVILLITAAASVAYVKLLGGVKIEGRITESQMDTLCGLELLRYDVEMAGYGLPKALPQGAPAFTYNESVSSGTTPDATAFNDAPGIPRAFVFSNNTGQKGADDNASDVLVIKSMVASPKASNRKWSFLYNDGVNWRIKAWDDTGLNFSAANPIDRIIVLGENGALQRTGSTWQFDFLSGYASDATALPLPSSGGVNVVYGVISSDDNGTSIRMPFNRVDYYLKRPTSNFPSRCFPGSFILYRATINHGNGARNEQQSLIDCVMDFQVAFGVDSNGDQAPDTWLPNLNLADADGDGTVADEIRAMVREVRIFILYQEGQRDDNFRFSGTLNLGDAQIANNANFQTLDATALAGALSTFAPTGDAARYRWKVTKLVMKPMNLD
jgi:prepilin-type N-terminal cleavage/methylation domain-containing protein